jgi:hypothetical protein
VDVLGVVVEGVVAEEVLLLEGVLVFKDLSGKVVVLDIMYVVLLVFLFPSRKGVTIIS